MEDFCVSDNRIRTGRWYYPKNLTPAECTYCEYCVRNGCVDNSILNELNLTNRSNCNCDCPERHSHPAPIELICPACEVATYGLRALRASSEDVSIGICHICSKLTPSEFEILCFLCSACSQKCIYCGGGIMNGNEYIKLIKIVAKKLIKQYRRTSILDDVMAFTRQKIRDSLNLYKNKSSGEIIKILRDKKCDNIVHL